MDFALALSLAAALSALSAAPSAQGDWMTPGGWSKVRIAPCADRKRLCGTIVWLKKSNDKAGRPLLDRENPDPKLRSRSLVGLPFITGFKPSGPGKWGGGKIYDPDSGKTYGSKMQLESDGTLSVSGCVLVICKSQTWRRPT